MSIKELDIEFIGTGSVKGFKFTQKASTDKGYIYEVDSGDEDIHYEVFERRTSAICINFENRIYSEEDFKEIYPQDKDFGVNAWVYIEYEEALDKLNSL